MKLKFDSHSLKAKIGMNFILFAVILMIFLWGVQVLFLNTFYQSMKESTTKNIMRHIESSYSKLDSEEFIETVSYLATDNDVYMYLTYTDGTPLLTTEATGGFSMHAQDVQKVYAALLTSNKDSVSVMINASDDGRKTLGYGKILTASDKPAIIAYLISPLWPMGSTIEILKKQLLYVTGLSLILALLLALYLSSRISTPIQNITHSAKKLAQGEYGIVFHGGPYTELNDLADTLTQTSIELEKSTSLQKDLIANVSHDLKTPLTMVKSYAEMIRDLSGDNPEKREKHLQVIIEEADRLNLLVSDLLTLSKMQSGAIVIDRTDFELRPEVESVLMYYKLLREEEGYIVNFECPDDIRVNGDPERLKQVFANLINNALKFCGDDRTVNVIIRKKGRSALCQIQDHGIGISAEDLAHIWERYYKASSNMVRTTSGTGLGLSIVKEILSLHKVRYGVDSTLGEGTTFWFELDLV